MHNSSLSTDEMKDAEMEQAKFVSWSSHYMD